MAGNTYGYGFRTKTLRGPSDGPTGLPRVGGFRLETGKNDGESGKTGLPCAHVVGGSIIRCGCVLALALAALLAPAVARADNNGHAHSAAPHQGHRGVTLRSSKKPARAAALTPSSSAASNTADIPGQLVFHGGTVMQSNTVHAMYWFPSGYSVNSSWTSAVNSFFSNVASDSGKTSNVFSVTPQYGVGYNAHFAGGAIDTDPFPTSGCSAGVSGRPCLSEEQIFTELQAFAKREGWAADPDAVTGSNAQPAAHPTHLFVVYLPPNVADCFDDQSACSANSANPYYCAYHTAWMDDAQTYVWANMPWSWDDPGCQAGTYPNSLESDTAADVTSHEYIEALTDPYLDAWYDAGGYEIADKCQSSFGSTLTGGGDYNQLIHSARYWLQLEYSNKLGDCYQVGAPVVSSMSPSTGLPGTTVTISGQNFFGTPTVKFNGISAAVLSYSTTSVTVTVPDGDFSGTVSVHAIGGTGSSSTIFGYPRPRVDSISPADGKIGTTVTLTGAKFTSVTKVKFGTLPATTFSVVNDGTITAQVPANFSSGSLVLVYPSGSVTTTQKFEVTKVTGMTPGVAPAGATVTITGQGLGSATTVDFPNHAGVPVSHAGALTVTVVVPDDATGGAQLVVHTPNIDAAGVSTPTTFNAKPTITSFTRDGQVGSLVTIVGKNMTDATFVKFGTIKLAASFDSDGNVTAYTPSGFSSGLLTVVTPHGNAVTTQNFAITKVTGFTPGKGPAGTVVTITGQGLKSVSTVSFGGSPPVAVTSTTGTTAKVAVPDDAVIGSITIYTPNIDPAGITSVGSFKPKPRITSFDAASYQAGNLVTAHGTNLTEIGSFSGLLGSVALTDLSVVDATTMTFTIPANAKTGAITFTNAAGTTTSTALVKIRPTIDSFAPLDDRTGKTVTLSGKTFNGTTAVAFGGVASPSFAVSNGGTTLTAVIPTAAVDGPITVTTPGGQTVSAGTFHVDPKITSFTPSSAAVGTTIVVTGTGLASVDQIAFGGGVTATPSQTPTATKLKVVVPPGATTGPFTFHAPSNTAPSPSPLTITFSVTSMSKSVAPAGATVQLNGVGLTNVTSVTFGSASATISSQDSTSLQVVVPNLSGAVTISVTKGTHTIQVPGQFTPMLVTQAAPDQVTAGGTIVLHGSGLDSGTATFNGVDTPVDLAPDGSGGYTATVPDGFTGGTVAIADSYGDAIDESFPLFAVGSYSASHAAPGDTVTINLATSEDLTLTAVKAKFPGAGTVDATGGRGTITVTVPDGATDGAIQVSAAGPGGGSSGWATGGDFTIDRATVVLNEVAPTGSGAQIELYVTGGGGLGDTKIVWRSNGSSHTIDLPVQTVQAGDYVVVNTSIAVSEVTLEVKTPVGIEDGLALNDGGTPSSGFTDDVASLESDGVWGSTDSVDWSVLTAGQSVARTSSATPDDASNWSVASASIGSSN